MWLAVGVRFSIPLFYCACLLACSDTGEPYADNCTGTFRSMPLTVTEGDITSFVLTPLLAPTDKLVDVSMIGTNDPTVAVLDTAGFTIANPPWTSPPIAVRGVDDGVAAGDRSTLVQGMHGDCGDSIDFARVTVVDRQSQNVLASNWNLRFAPGSFDVVLAQPPSAPVTVTLLPSSGIGTTPRSLTFDATSYGIAQRVAFTAAMNGNILLMPDGGIASRSVEVRL
jgi:hypothetical protein